MFKLNTTKPNLSMGARGEKSAEVYLKKCGYKIIVKNFTNVTGRRLGEIDIIAKEREEIVFIEVKTRKISFREVILPEENINRSKLYKLNKIASFYISQNKLFNCSYRFDAITVLADDEKRTAKIRHLKNIFI